ncbi:MAG TPA: hypothetical protein VFP57_10085 [Sphingomicrobium sp.]|jgi:ElaB/YqjD/DUF883 family membrane-anchored ribosome-binding protein|nr:hypothetical protein [Sphingomicrobium sp.]
MQPTADDQTDDLPEGTDTVIEGAANSGSISTDRSTAGGGTVTIEDTALVRETEIPAPSAVAERPVRGSGSPESGLADRFRSGREKIASQAGERARGLVSQGLERTAETLANVSKMVGDTADGIEERLGADYGDYARRAAGAIESAASTIAEKDPDELIEDTRNFVRNSPGIALAGAAVVGFVVARLLKSGIAADRDDEDEDDRD